jgi:hypothetical protein
MRTRLLHLELLHEWYDSQHHDVRSDGTMPGRRVVERVAAR